jgi:hypothetical protein
LAIEVQILAAAVAGFGDDGREVQADAAEGRVAGDVSHVWSDEWDYWLAEFYHQAWR